LNSLIDSEPKKKKKNKKKKKGLADFMDDDTEVTAFKKDESETVDEVLVSVVTVSEDK